MKSDARSEPAAGQAADSEWTLNVSAVAAFIWFCRVIEFVLPALHNPASVVLSPDDAMRLSEVRDLLAGQSWFDLTQWRMDVPVGLPMHWSRLIDAPIAGLIVLLRQFLEPHTAETVAICLWPLIPLLAAWIAIGRVAEHLAGKKCGVIAVLLAASAAVVLGYFLPGVIDHHNVQVALTLWAIAFLVEIDTRRAAAIGAAIVSVLSLAIGLEVLPYVVTTVLAVATMWVLQGVEIAGAVRRFGMSFAVASLIILVGFTSTHERSSVVCDAFSGLYALLAVFGGLGLTALTFVPINQHARLVRAALCLMLGLTLVLLTALVSPVCLGGPYAGVSPLIAEIFLSRVEEVQSPLLNAASDWSSFYYGYIYCVVGLGGCILSTFMVAANRRTAAITLTVFAAMSFAVMSVEVRGILFSVLVSLAGLAASLQLLIERWTRPGWQAALATIFALIVANDTTFAYTAAGVRSFTADKSKVVARARADSLSHYCFGQPSVGQLAGLPTGRVVAFLDQGAAILAFSKHSVVAGPYHRNEQVECVEYALFTKPPSTGAQIAQRRGLDYVVVCKTSYDYAFYLANSGANGLLGRLAAHHVPAWLSPVPSVGSGGRVTIYRVLPSQLSR